MQKETIRTQIDVELADRIRAFCKERETRPSAFFALAFGLALKAYTNAEEAYFTACLSDDGTGGQRLPVRMACKADETTASMLTDIGTCIQTADTPGKDGSRQTGGSNDDSDDVLFCYRQDEGSTFDNDAALALTVTASSDGSFHCETACDAARYSAYTIRGFALLFIQISKELLIREKNGEIALLSPEQEQELRDFYDTDYPVAERPAYRLFQDTAEKIPEKTALIAVDRTMSYQELNGEANSLGRALQELNVGPETIVAVLAERNSYAYVMHQGVLKSGGAFMPIDPEYPEERIRYILENSGAKLALTTHEVFKKREALLSKLSGEGIRILFVEDTISGSERDNINADVPYDALAYVIYTSGSTGKPKGVMLTNRGLVNFVDDNEKNGEVYCLAKRGSVLLALAAFTFDVSVMEEFTSFANGNTVVLATQEQIMNPVMLMELMLRTRVDTLTCTPSYLLNLTAIDSFHPAIRQLKSVDVGSEAFPAALFGKLRALNPELYIINSYGPTEATISSTLDVLESEDDITIGTPIANYHVATLDRDGRLQPLGATGELVIMGEGVGRGYIGRDDLTKKSFITLLGKRAYRSGDLVCIREDGKIEFHGRMDNLVKLHGLRIELGEIESVLNSYPGVRSSIVLVIHGETDYLGAWFTADHEIPISDLKAHLASKLTAYMIPQAFLQLPELPLTANGKIDKKALPALEFEEEEIVPPENDMEEKLLDMIVKLTGNSKIGVTNDFFASGLSSITSIRLCVMIAEQFGRNVKVSEIYDAGNVRSLCEALAEKPVIAQDVYSPQSDYPLSMTQMGIFIESERYPDTTIYNIPSIYHLDDTVDIERFCRAVQTAVAAHPYLFVKLIRTAEGKIRVVRRDGIPFAVSVISCDSLPEEEVLMRPFDIMSDELLFRAELYTTSEGNYFFLDTHHIVSDGVSIEVLERDIERAYQGVAVETEHYTGCEFALDEEKARQGKRYQEAKAFYDGIFSGISGETMPVQDGKAVKEQLLRRRLLGKSSAHAVQTFCETNGITLNAFFTFAFGVALKSFTCSEEAVFSTIYNGRNDPRLSSAVCMLVKTLPVRLTLNKDSSVLSEIEACRRYLVSAMANDVFGFADIRDAYGIKGDALFAFQGEYQHTATFGGQPATLTVPLLSQAMSAIGIELYTDGDALIYDGEIDPELYSEYTLNGLMETLDHVIGQLLKKETLGEITLVSKETEEIIRALHDTDFPVAERPAYRLLQDTAEKMPEKTALIAIDRTMNYRELNEEANAVGHALRDAGAAPETIVAVLAERNSYAYVMRQGVLKSGGAFMPIDPEYPEERIRYILENSGAKLALTTHEVYKKREALFSALLGEGIRILFAEDTASGHERDNLNLDVPYDALAYVIYTSGSTGKPKGVMLTNRSLVHFVDDNEKNGEVNCLGKRGNVLMAIAALTFDVSVMEEFVPFANGTTVVLATQEQIMTPALLKELMLQNHVETLTCTPSYLLNLTAIDSFHPAIRQLKSVDVGSEVFPAALFEKLREINPELYIINSYGPTEATISSTLDVLNSGDDITIGTPIANYHVATLDRDGRLQPPGATGELVIMGEGVGRGYIGRDDLTKKSFITLLGMRAYRSGDLVRIREDGKIEFHGRMDNLVKLHGLRIELGEIESVLNSYPGVRSSIVLVVQGETDYLGAWFTADHEIPISDLKGHLASRLTAYMIPQAFLQLPELPLTANGKIDKKALPALTTEGETITEPETELQEQLLALAKEVIGSEKIGVDTDLFAVGLSSISCIRLIALAEERFGLTVRIQDLFECQTIRRLETMLGCKEASETYELRTEYPLSMTQMGIYADSILLTDNTAYNIPCLYKLGEDIDITRLRDVLERALLAHPYLFMTLRQKDSGDVCAVRHAPEHIDIPVEDILPPLDTLEQPFDLRSENPLYRVRLFDTKDGKYLFMDTHHIISDGASIDILMEDIKTAYAGGDVEPEAYTGFEYALDEEKLRTTERYERAKAWYEAMLSDSEREMLPDGDMEGGEEVPAHLVHHTNLKCEAVSAFCKANGITENAFFNAVFAFALSAFTGRQEAFYATIYNGRMDSRLSRAVTMLVKTFPVRIQVTKSHSIKAFASSMGEQLMNSMSNDLCSFAELAQTYGISSDILFAYQGDSDEAYIIGGEKVEPIEFSLKENKAPLLFQVYAREDHFMFDCDYRGDLFSESYMHIFADCLETAADQFLTVQTLKDVSLINSKAGEVIERLNQTEAPYPVTDIVSVFRAAAEKYPDRISLRYKDEMITYRREDDLSERIAGRLKIMGIGRGDVVSVLIHRSANMRIVSLGVLKAGAAYQPLDPDYPDERLAFMMNDAGCKLLIADEDLLGKVSGYNGPLILTKSIPELPVCEKITDHPAPEDLFILLYTSGSTGTPKGVMLEHGNIANFCFWYRDYYHLEADSCVSAYASYGFDACMMDMYPALTVGACVCIMEEEIRLDLAGMEKRFNQAGITHAFMTTQVGRQFYTMTAPEQLKWLSVGGEKLVPVPPREGQPTLVNGYGPTECTIFTTTKIVDRSYKRVPIGKPLSNCKLYVVDENMQLLPPFIPGELLIAGRGVGRGYLNRPELTEKSFIKNPFSDDPEYARVYRTGDVVRLLADGNIDFIGRNDSQVKVRGFRIELTEIETVIRDFPGIVDTTVQAFEDQSTGEKYIAAYVVSDSPVDVSALNDFIRSQKPAYMVPAVTMQIDAVPLNQNQKVNKKALPKPEPKKTETSSGPAAPLNILEQELKEMLSSIVNTSDFNITDDLRDLGLTSISGIRLSVMIYKKYGVNLNALDLISKGTLQRIENEILTALLSRDQNEKELSSKQSERGLKTDYPLSMTQMGIFTDSVRMAGTTVYNIPFLYQLDAGIDMERLRNALEQVILAHPCLFMMIRSAEGSEVRAFCNVPERIDIPVRDVLPSPDVLVHPFDLTSGEPLYRVELFNTPEGKYLFMDIHHIIYDGTSTEILMDDLNSAYAGDKVESEEYTGFDFALDEQTARASERLEAAKAWYDSVCRGCEPCTLPVREESCDPDVEIGTGRITGETDANTVREFCEEHSLTPNAFFTTAFALALKAYTGSESAVFCTIYNGRKDPRMERSVGMFVKTLPVVMDCAADKSVTETVSACQTYLLNAMANDIFSFAEIKDAYGIEPDVLFAYQGEQDHEDGIGGLPCEAKDLSLSRAKSAFGLDISINDRQVVFETEYDPALYTSYTIDGFAHMLDVVCGEMLIKEKIRDIRLTSDADEQTIRNLHDTDWPVSERPAYRLFQDTAEKMPEKTAVIAVDRTMSYQELNGEANALGRALRELGVGPETIVAVLAERNSYAYVMHQGVLKSGGAFMQIDPEYPEERVRYILENSGAKLALTTHEVFEKREALLSKLSGEGIRILFVEDTVSGHESVNINLDVPYDALAYVIYTSGSTGKPKGVMLTNRGLVHFVDDNEKNGEVYCLAKRGSVLLALAALTFDVSVMEEFTSFANGNTVVLATKEQIMNPTLLMELMMRTRVDTLTCTPSYLSNLVAIDSFHPAIRQLKSVDVGSEAFPAALFGKLRELNPELYIINSYGPTEATISSTLDVLESEDDITIGTPIANYHVATFDREGRLQPLGATGELVIMGEGVGRGYIGRDDLTKKSFITLLGKRAYRSGDMVRIRKDGKIEFHGRMDNLVKLRGLRVELGEIESVLNGYPGVRSSIVVVDREAECLAAYFTADKTIPLNDLKKHLSAYLTAYMVPQAIRQLDEMPLTANGKIDKKALPAIMQEKAERHIEHPVTDLQRQLCELFEKALGIDEVGINESFFELGGTSLKASIVLMSAIRNDIPIVYQDIFDAPTVEALEQIVLKKQGREEKEPETVEAAEMDCLACNTNAHLSELTSEPLGNVLLAGATGFLGIHVLRELIENTDNIIYCLVRSGKLSAEMRLKSELYYYFDTVYEELFGSRLFVVEGDITQPDNLKEAMWLGWRTVINCAASVKHFADLEFLMDINVHGVENLTSLCLEKGARLIHISTVSVAGNAIGGRKADQILHENRLDMGQEVQSNAYVYTKYLAEKHVLEMIEKKGLDAKIIRVGNLSSRVRDGEFQMNFRTNAFMNSLRAYVALGCYPLNEMSNAEELSYIEETAQAVVLLSGTNRSFTIFHAYNSHTVEMGNIIYTLNRMGLKVEPVKEDVFQYRLREGLADEAVNRYLSPLVDYDLDDDENMEEIPAENSFTINALYHLGFQWTITDMNIIENMIESLRTLGFFDL